MSPFAAVFIRNSPPEVCLIWGICPVSGPVAVWPSPSIPTILMITSVTSAAHTGLCSSLWSLEPLESMDFFCSGLWELRETFSNVFVLGTVRQEMAGDPKNGDKTYQPFLYLFLKIAIKHVWFLLIIQDFGKLLKVLTCRDFCANLRIVSTVLFFFLKRKWYTHCFFILIHHDLFFSPRNWRNWTFSILLILL